MVHISMYGPAGSKPHYMEFPVVGFCKVCRVEQCPVLKERAVMYGHNYARQVMEYRAPCADGKMPYFRISLLSPRKSCGSAGGLQRRERIIFFQFAERRHLCELPG